MHIDLMPALYFPVCALFVQIALSMTFFSRSQTIRQNNKLFAWMLIFGLLDALLITVVMLLLYIDYHQFDELTGWINKVDFMLYIMWVTFFLLYICTIPNKKNQWFIQNRSRLVIGLSIFNVLIWMFILVSPIKSHNINNLTFYETGLSTEIPLIVCAIYLVLVLVRTITLKRELTRRYAAVPVVLSLLLLTVFIRAYYPGISIIPFVAALSNLTIMLTFENPDARLLEIEIYSRKKLNKINATKDDFISMASHQLRTPLTSVKGYISMLLDGDFGRLSARQKEVLREAYISSERMAFIISDFLDVSRLQTGQFELQKTPTLLGDVLNSEINQLQITATSHNVQLIYEPAANLPIINCDQNKLRQVMMNMIDNAIFYSHEQGKVEVALYQKNRDVVFTVRDHGIGVPHAEQARLFTKFYRASNARRVRPDGTGVGLFMARKVVMAHGGSLIFESKENAGSTFGFRLPIKSKD